MIAKNLDRASIALAAALVAHSAFAAPTLTVVPIGFNGANRLWAADVAPDPALFAFSPGHGTTGGSVAAELAFSIVGTDLISATVNTNDWPFANRGTHPFVNLVNHEGLWVDLVGDRIFASFGTAFMTSPGPRRLLTIETLGNGPSTMLYGTAASGHARNGARISQASQNFDGYTGSVTVPEPSTIAFIILGIGTFVGTLRRRR